MHMVIRALVFAKDEGEALEKAKEIFDALVDARHYDYYTTFDDDTSPVSGKARWGNFPVVARADSPEGRQLIDDGMRFTWETFKENITKIRRTLNEFTDEEIFEREPDETKMIALKLKGDDELQSDLYSTKFYFRLCGGHPTSCWLYDPNGVPIHSRQYLKRILSRRGAWASHKGETLFVVPADVHY